MARKENKAVMDAVVLSLIAVRKEKQLSHESLARGTGLSRAAISFIEARKREPTLLSLLAIADCLGCDLGRMISDAVDDVKRR